MMMEVMGLEQELKRERVAHLETQGYLKRALRMATHYHQLVEEMERRTDGIAALPTPVTGASDSCTSGSGGVGVCGGSASQAHLLATLGCLARLGEYLLRPNPLRRRDTLYRLYALAHQHLDALGTHLGGPREHQGEGGSA